MQATTSLKVETEPPHASAGLGIETPGHALAKPISVGVKSPAPLQSASLPPQARHMRWTFLASACWRTAVALPSPGVGQGFECDPASFASQHLPSAFARTARYLAASFPIARWHLLS